MIGHFAYLSTYDTSLTPPMKKRPFNLEIHWRKGLVAVRACEMDATLRHIVVAITPQEYPIPIYLTVVTADDLPVVVSTSTCDGLCGRLVDCLYTNLLKFQSHPALDIDKKLHVGKARA